LLLCNLVFYFYTFMSCTTSACVGCGSSKDLFDFDDELNSLSLLIVDAKRNWSIPLDDVESEKWDQVLNEIGLRLSFKNAQSLHPLVDVYNQFGAKTFLNLSENLLLMKIVGKLVCWAYMFCESDSKKFVEKVLAGDKELINYVNQQAEFFECFSENGKVGRAIHKQPPEIKVFESNGLYNSYYWIWLSCCTLFLFAIIGLLVKQ